MNRPKITLIALIVPFLAANVMAMDMLDNPIFNELIQRPFEHEDEAYRPTIELCDNAAIGYGAPKCLEELHRANIKVDKNSPLMPFIITNNPDIGKVIHQQVCHEVQEARKILREERANSNETKTQKREKYNLKKDIFRKRIELMVASANKLLAISELPWPTLIPIEYLDDNNITLNPFDGTPVSLKFNDCQKIEALKKDFEKQPTTNYFSLTQTIANKLNGLNEETLEYERRTTLMEVLKQITAQQMIMESNNIIERRAPQYDDFQTASTTFQQSNIIMHTSNHYNHGENGYSTEKERHNLLDQKFNGKDIVNSIHKRETGINKRKLSQITAEELSDLQNRDKMLKYDSSKAIVDRL